MQDGRSLLDELRSGADVASTVLTQRLQMSDALAVRRHHRSQTRVRMSANPAQAGSREGVRPAGSDTSSCACIATPGFADYALVDSGNGRKLERFGRFTVDRPEPQAMWQPALEPGVWLQGRCRLQERRRRGGRRRRALAQGHADAGDVAAARARRHRALPAHELPASRGLSRAAAALAVDARLAAGPARRDPARPQPLRLHGCRLADRRPRRGRGDARRRLQAGDRLGQAEPGRLQARRGADPLDPRGRAQVRGARGAARQDLSPDPHRPAEVRARARPARCGTCSSTWRRCCATARPCSARGARRWCSPPMRSAPPRSPSTPWCANAWSARQGTIESGELAVVEESGGRLLPTSSSRAGRSDDARLIPGAGRRAPSPACRTSG